MKYTKTLLFLGSLLITTLNYGAMLPEEGQDSAQSSAQRRYEKAQYPEKYFQIPLKEDVADEVVRTVEELAKQDPALAQRLQKIDKQLEQYREKVLTPVPHHLSTMHVLEIIEYRLQKLGRAKTIRTYNKVKQFFTLFEECNTFFGNDMK